MKYGATGGTAAAILVLAAVSGCSDPAVERGDDGQVIGRTSAHVFEVRKGDCVDDPQVISAQQTELTDITLVHCSEPHTAEVYVDLELDGSGAPDEDAFSELFDEHCVEEFSEYVGAEPTHRAVADLGITAFYPTDESWQRGDRLFQCLIVGSEGFPLVGSARDLIDG
ncbi:septum formation family protein [Zhihengliuella flava]|uniref:Septum formation-related domain-containing protein n=1 Tax=Zhihengliuella flava TaxID=1285193 RepID=A0A931DBN1_9MICC|nr:septum formation family protein [Zhihengliuella flava]MBG6084571.1 hypothetical protein [Zhihengliuella flava]